MRQRAETLLNNNHYDPKAVKDIADGVTGRWQQLVTRAEERHKLVTASLNFYKTAEQVPTAFIITQRVQIFNREKLSTKKDPENYLLKNCKE